VKRNSTKVVRLKCGIEARICSEKRTGGAYDAAGIATRARYDHQRHQGDDDRIPPLMRFNALKLGAAP